MFSIAKGYRFEAAHQLDGLPEGHKCHELHGHSYKVQVVISSSQLNKTGFVVDFVELNKFYDEVVQPLDHHFLNDILDFNPTAELIAKYIYEKAINYFVKEVGYRIWIQNVTVWETEKCFASYDGPDDFEGYPLSIEE